MKYATTTLNIELYRLINLKREQENLSELEENKMSGDKYNELCNNIKQLEKAIKIIKPTF